MNVSVVGCGYVGTTVAGCLAELGHDVVAIDIDEDIVSAINAGDPPLHEPGLGELVETHAGSRLRATTDYDAVLDTELTILAIQTPSREDGSIDASAIEAAAGMLGETLATKDDYHLAVVKSTVIPDTIEDRLVPAIEEGAEKTDGEELGVAVNPEFQREGTAVEDFMDPSRVVLGTEADERALARLRTLYEPLTDDEVPVVETGRREASMIKYASNVFLASKISLINELANICKEYGVDAYEVADAMGLDDRIGAKFLRSGVGWGGSCLTGEQSVLVETQTGTELLTLAEFLETHVSGEQVDDVSVLSMAADGTFSFKPVEAATKRRYDGLLYTVETDTNKTVTVTSDHPMLVKADGLDVREARTLEEGDRLPVVDDIPENSVGEFDLIEMIANTDAFDNGSVYLKPRFDLEDDEQQLRSALDAYDSRVSHDKIGNFLRDNHISLDVFLIAESKLEFRRPEFRLTTSPGQPTDVPAVIQADQDLWRLVGYYISAGQIEEDGSRHDSDPRRQITLSFHRENESESVADVKSLLRTYAVEYRTQEKHTEIRITFASRVFAPLPAAARIWDRVEYRSSP
ncbi:MAG: nucleotide sugar dehydrogenase [uncultured archaeon A07HR60]|nr:MAG: nucleotide sugar dehydrogenase [uncultured archaeon A07HR60]